MENNLKQNIYIYISESIYLYLHLYFLKYLFIYLFLAASGLSCRMWHLCCGIWDLSLWRMGFFLVVACRFFLSLVVEQAPESVGSVVCGAWALQLRSAGSVAVTCSVVVGSVVVAQLSCSMWDLSFPTRDRTCIPLHWKADSLPLDHQGSLYIYISISIYI